MIERILKWSLGVIFFVFLCYAFYHPIEIEDGWWHLAAGRWMVEHKEVPRTDPFAFTQTQSPWILTQWLGSLIYYMAYMLGDLEGVKLLRLVLFVGIAGIAFTYAQRYLPFVLAVALICVLIPALWARCFIRPDVFNYIFIQLFLIQLLAWKRDGAMWRLLCLPLLGCVWGNLHLGSFVFGSLLITLGSLATLGEAVICRCKNNSNSVNKNVREALMLLYVLVMFLLSMCVSPYGFDALRYAVSVFSVENVIGFYRSRMVIAEQLPPDYVWTLKGWWFWLLAAGGLWAAVKLKQNRFFFVVLFVAAVIAFSQANRAGAFFGLVCVYLMIESARQNNFIAAFRSWRFSRIFESGLCVFLSALLMLQTVAWAGEHVYTDGKYVKDTALDIDPSNPIKAVEFLLDNNIHGRVFANDTSGGYLIWRAYPKLKPVVDGRQLDQRLFTRFLMLTQRRPEFFWDRFEQDHVITIVLLDMSHNWYYRLAAYLLNQRRWQLVFVDGRSVVLVRRGKFKLSQDVFTFESRLRDTLLDPVKIGLLQAVAMMPQRLSLWQKLRSPLPHDVDRLQEGFVLCALGFKAQGVERMLSVAQVNPIKTREAYELLHKAGAL